MVGKFHNWGCCFSKWPNFMAYIHGGYWSPTNWDDPPSRSPDSLGNGGNGGSHPDVFEKMDVGSQKSLVFDIVGFTLGCPWKLWLVSKLVYNLLMGLITYLWRGYNPVTKYHGHPSKLVQSVVWCCCRNCVYCSFVGVRERVLCWLFVVLVCLFDTSNPFHHVHFALLHVHVSWFANVCPLSFLLFVVSQ